MTRLVLFDRSTTIKARLHQLCSYWWAREDSNLRLPPCEDGTLTAELLAHGLPELISQKQDRCNRKALTISTGGRIQGISLSRRIVFLFAVSYRTVRRNSFAGDLGLCGPVALPMGPTAMTIREFLLVFLGEVRVSIIAAQYSMLLDHCRWFASAYNRSHHLQYAVNVFRQN